MPHVQDIAHSLSYEVNGRDRVERLIFGGVMPQAGATREAPVRAEPHPTYLRRGFPLDCLRYKINADGRSLTLPAEPKQSFQTASSGPDQRHHSGHRRV